MKKVGFVIFLTFNVLLAVGAMNKNHWIAYIAFVAVCVASIVDIRRYAAISQNRSAKYAIVAILFTVACAILVLQAKGG